MAGVVSSLFSSFFLSFLSVERLGVFPSPPSPPYLLTLRVPHLWPRLTDPQPGDITKGSRKFDDQQAKGGEEMMVDLSHVGLG